MTINITSPAADPFIFTFAEPAIGGADQHFEQAIDFSYTPRVSVFILGSYNGLTSNFGNVDRHGHDPALVHLFTKDTDLLTGGIQGIQFLTASTGRTTVGYDLPFEYYNRLGAGEVVTIQTRLTITDTVDSGSDTKDIYLRITGANDTPIAHNDVRAVNDNISSFTDGFLLLNDDDPDIHDTLTVTNAVLSGPVTGVPAFPPEYVAHPGAVSVSHDGTSVTFKPDPYFQFLGPGEKANFKILYTISDGHGGTSSAFLTVTINGLATQNFVGTKGDDNMLGENDTDNMDGAKGNDIIHARGGNDKVFGDKGNDILDGGTGGDQLFGEKGHDTFLYKGIADSTVSGAGRDKIKDFEHGDHIDLSALFGGVFAFIKSKAFHNVAGELRYEKSGHNIVVEGDTTGDGTADFAIRVDHLSKIGAGDFVL